MLISNVNGYNYFFKKHVLSITGQYFLTNLFCKIFILKFNLNSKKI